MAYYDIDNKLVYKAYKKFKSATYFDKTELPLVEQIVDFENEYRVIENRLDEIYSILRSKDVEWNKFISGILSKTDATICPKKFEKNGSKIVFNNNTDIKVKSLQYFIKLPIEGHILSVLWILLFGSFLDIRKEENNNCMSNCSFGNRLSKKLTHTKKKEITSTPYLFEPYYSQYDSWRKEALTTAKRQLELNKDAVVLNLDLRRFFYSVHIPKKYYDTILEDYISSYGDEDYLVLKRLHEFVYKIMAKYSYIVREKDNVIGQDGCETCKSLHIWENGESNLGVFLPIGFLPSNILSNWYLTPLDNIINDQINPVYYGRYVDDIIIVNKVEEGSKLAKKNQEDISVVSILEYYLIENTKTEIIKKCNPEETYKDDNFKYKINPEILYPKDKVDKRDYVSPQIIIMNDKVKVFYFNKNETTALIDCFENEIGQNVSEFRFLPDMDMAIFDRNYGDIIKIENNSNSPKLRNINDFSLDKYSLSKFLGKYRKVSEIISGRNYDYVEEDLLKLLDEKSLIENYTLWDRLLEIMLIKGNYTHYKTLINKIAQAITKTTLCYGCCLLDDVKKSLSKNLYVAICRTAVICWSRQFDNILKEIEDDLTKKYELDNVSLNNLISYKEQYWRSCMINKYILPFPVAYIDIGKLKEASKLNTTKNISILEDSLEFFKDINPDSLNKKDYNHFLPYIISPHEISYTLLLNCIHNESSMYDHDEYYINVKKVWNNLNGYTNINSNKSRLLDKYIQMFNMSKDAQGLFDDSEDFEAYLGLDQEDKRKRNDKRKKNIVKKKEGTNYYAVKVGDKFENVIKIGIGNICLDEKIIEDVMMRRPDRSYSRYKKLANILNTALKEEVDLLILPEGYIPLEWMLEIYRFCANSQIGIITGVEHVLRNESVYNFTATILPYKTETYKFAYIDYHQKVHYSPEEARQIKGHGYKIKEGNEYTLFNWKNLWFSVYCCFELTSIIERSKFQSLADLTIAVEWNRDVTYFNNIIDSLSRDLHCYCIQSNNAKYGDNRIVLPARKDVKDLIKSKGGINEIILIDKINANKLREFQCKEYELQKEDKNLKPTPPNFNKKAARYKLERTLWQHIEEFKL